jgi:hypothetical protein
VRRVRTVRKPDMLSRRECHGVRVSRVMKPRPKRLCPLGNSLALIIDMSIRRRLGLGRRTELHVYTDGRRIIAEQVPRPTHDPVEAARIAFDLRKNAFVETLGMIEHEIGPQHLEQLGAGRTSMWSLRSKILNATNGTPSELLLMDRLEHVRAGIQARMLADDAVQHAVAAVPEPLPLPRPRKRRRATETRNAAPR